MQIFRQEYCDNWTFFFSFTNYVVMAYLLEYTILRGILAIVSGTIYLNNTPC